MVEPPIMDALRNKRSEVAGLVKDLEQLLGKHRASLSHLDATMRLFDTNIDAGELVSNQQRANTTSLRHGECLRLIYDALRDAPQPLTTRELAEHIMEMKSMPSTDAARRELIQKAILNSLTHAKGTITRIESKGVVSWQIHQAARALPIAAEIDRRLAAHCETYDGVGLIAVTHAAVVFAPCSFTRVTDEISTGNVVVVVAELSTAQAREIRPNAIGASAIDAEADLVIDPLHGETGVQLVPCRAFIRMNSGPMDDALSDCWQRLLFGAKYLGQRATIALAHHQDNLPLARLVLSKPSVDRISGKILWPDMTAEISSVDFRGVSLATDTQRLDAGGHRLVQFVCQNKGRLVLHIELTTEGKHTVALHLITKDDGREQVNSQWQLVLGEQCARCDRKVFSARLAAPSRWTRGSRTGITNLAATAGTNWFTVGLRPAQAQKYVIDLTIRHKHNLGSTKRARRRGKQKMLSHNHLQTERYPNPLLPEALKKYNPLFAGGLCYIRPYFSVPLSRTGRLRLRAAIFARTSTSASGKHSVAVSFGRTSYLARLAGPPRRHPGGQNSSAQVGQNSLSQPDKFAQIGIVYLQPIHVIEEETDRLSGSMLIAVPEQPLDPLQVSQQFRTRCLIMMSDTTSVLAQHRRAHSDMEPVTAGIPLNMVQKWTDHAQLTTTAIYANAVGAEEKDIARKM